MARVIKYYLSALLVCSCQLILFGLHNKTDSLLVLLKNDKADTCKLVHLCDLSFESDALGDYPAELRYSNRALELADTLLSQTHEAIVLKTANKYKAKAYNSIGRYYYYLGSYPEALKNHLTSLKISEAINYREGVAASFNNIGLVYFQQNNCPEALKNYNASLELRKSIDDKRGIASCYGNMGLVYRFQKNYSLALKNYFACLKIMEAIGDKRGAGSAYNNIGNVYLDQGNYPEALKNHFASLKIKESIDNKTGIALSFGNIGKVLTKQKKYKEAESYLVDAINLSKKIGYKENLREVYSNLAELYCTVGNYKEAFQNQNYLILYKDSIYNEETRIRTIQNQMTFDFEKKEAATRAEQEKKDILATERLKQKEQQRNYFIIGFALVGLLALFILRGYQQKQKANTIILRQKIEVEKSKHIIEEKNKDITDSINYAKRIQHAILPHNNDIVEAFPESFILFKPKDIVSGDFYFFHKKNQSSFIAAADCTGHGVPGALMSMIGAEKLNEAVTESSDTSEMLSLLNKGIKNALKQTDSNESTRDGMDIALCSVNTENRILSYAGANRPLWIIRKGQTVVEEIKATKKAIGGLTDDNQHFETHELQLQQGDTFYLFSDGYADLFSGKSGKKLTTKKLRQVLIEIQHNTMPEQKEYLDNYAESWKAEAEQIDDILIIGIRL
jgi:serine phosphatase RsbU (regulator of sigma subunit)